jgi:hypothetical protein
VGHPPGMRWGTTPIIWLALLALEMIVARASTMKLKRIRSPFRYPSRITEVRSNLPVDVDCSLPLRDKFHESVDQFTRETLSCEHFPKEPLANPIVGFLKIKL